MKIRTYLPPSTAAPILVLAVVLLWGGTATTTSGVAAAFAPPPSIPATRSLSRPTPQRYFAAAPLDASTVGADAAAAADLDSDADTDGDDADDDDADFPPPLTPVQRTTRAVEFYKRVLPVLAAYKAKEVELFFRRKVLPGYELSREEEDAMWAEMDEWGSTRIAQTIEDMKGYYVKTGQVVSTRADLFPEAYTEKLTKLQDGIEPMPIELVEKVVRQELLDGAPLSELFASFDEKPLGSASIAQVHRATLLDGRVVAVKLQRPNVEPKLLGDVANLKRISKALAKSLPVDYYTVFCELGDALERELDFLAEAQAMKKIYMAVNHDNDGTSDSAAPVTVPLPVGELVSKRVLVMDFVEGVPLNKLQERMREKGIEPGSAEAKLAGRRILDSLSVAFGRMIFGAGFIHGDPHPGNIFIGEGGKVSLIDCGQFKALPRPQRVQLAELVLAVDAYQTTDDADTNAKSAALKKVAELVRSFGVKLAERKEEDDDLACAVALFLFGDADRPLPGGYSTNELSDNSPIKLVASFPQELVLLGRATVLLKGIAKKLDVPFSLGGKWGDGCRLTVEAASEPKLPLWGGDSGVAAGGGAGPSGGRSSSPSEGGVTGGKVRFGQVTEMLKLWGKGKTERFLKRTVDTMPPKVRTRLVELALKRAERKEARTRRRGS